MCGILGVNKINNESIRRAADTFNYRGPDYTGVYSDDQLTFIHHRLSIIDTSQSANQPMSSEDGNIVLIFNGEIYNFQEIKKNYFSNDHFFSNSDTEIIIKCYKKFGISLTQYLEGMYAFAIYDKKQEKIFLFRDSEGIKPLYYYCYDEQFIFASEIKGILSYLKSAKIQPEINNFLVDIYFTLGYIPSPDTLYKNIYKLKAGHYLEYDIINKKILNNKKSVIHINRYENLEKKDFFNLLDKSILRHLISDVPVGLFFSGGTDSSVIASVLNKNKIKLKTFSIIMDHKTQDEYYSRQIAEKLGLSSEFIHFGINDFDFIYDQVVSKIDEPMYDSSIFPTFFISKIASQSVKVVLSGEGGDEFFYGYRRHLFLKGFDEHRRDDYLSFLDKIYSLLPKFSGKNRLFEKLFILNNQPYSFYLLSVALSLEKKGFIAAKKYLAEINRQKNILNIDQNAYLENDLLKKLDMATSYNSIEGRVPFLDTNIIQASRLMSANYFLKNSMNKFLLKEYLSNYLPKNLVYRGKSGFGVDPMTLINHSKKINLELDAALKYLQEKNLLPFNQNKNNLAHIKQKNPQLIFASLMLFHAIKNFENL